MPWHTLAIKIRTRPVILLLMKRIRFSPSLWHYTQVKTRAKYSGNSTNSTRDTRGKSNSIFLSCAHTCSTSRTKTESSERTLSWLQLLEVNEAALLIKTKREIKMVNRIYKLQKKSKKRRDHRNCSLGGLQNN